MTIRPLATLAVALSAGFVSSLACAATGRTAGALDVSLAGESHYTLPLFAPPGSHSMTPKLALVYGHRGGESSLGVGWSLSGASALTRCPRTWAQDGAPAAIALATSDRLCLDGNQLKLTAGTQGIAGSTYQTELDTFTRVTAYGSAGNGPAYFIAQGKDGLIYEYGNSTDSRIESTAAGFTTTPHTWALNQVRDRSGNAIVFNYYEDTTNPIDGVNDPPNGSFRLKSIQYTSNPTQGLAAAYTVSFVYEVKPAGEIDQGYVAGGRLKERYRVDRIDVTYSSTLVRRYELTYEASLPSTRDSRLASVQECAGASLDCFAATTFTYQNGTNGYGSEVTSGVALASPDTALPLDVNGDGRTDLVYSSSATSGGGTWMVMLANASGGFDSPVNSGITNTNFSQAIPIDYNADGREDFLVPYSGGTWWVVQGTASGLTSPVNTGIAASGAAGSARALDVNGDGLEDLVWLDTTANGIHYRLRVWGGSFSSSVSYLFYPSGGPYAQIISPQFGESVYRNRKRLPDFDGDGRSDIVVHVLDHDPYLGYSVDYWEAVLGSGGVMFLGTGVWANQPYFLDLNGDGYSDLIYAFNGTWYYRTFNGASAGLDIQGPSVGSLDINNAVVADWDSDGNQDLLARDTSTNTWWVWRSTGEQMDSAGFQNTGLSITSSITFAGDVNGDGLDDLLYVNSSNAFAYRPHAGVMPDLLTTVTDGFGNTVSFAYSPLTNASIYTRGSTATFPEQDFQGALTVVTSVTAANGIGGTYTDSYTYWRALLHRQGRGFEGFAARRHQEGRSGIFTYDYPYQSFPYTGMLYEQDVLQPNASTYIAQVINAVNAVSAGSGTEQRVYPYLATSTAKRWEVGGTYNGTQLTQTVTTTSVDAYGTAYDVTSTTTEMGTGNGAQPGAQYTSRVYLPTAYLVNDTGNWCLGVPTQIQTTKSHTQYGGGAITRTVNRTVDSAYCRVTQEVSEPGSATLAVTRDFGFDGFGNITTETVTGRKPDGTAMSARTTTTGWGTTGQFPMSVQNALGQSSTASYDFAKGLKSSETDPNGFAVQWQYDAFGRKTRETRPDSTSSTWSYADCTPNCVSSLNKLLVTETAYNAAGGVITDAKRYLDKFDRVLVVSERLLSGSYHRIDRTFDARGNLASESFPCTFTSPGTACTSVTTSQYDLLNRPTLVQRPISASNPTLQSITTAYEGLTTRTVDALGWQKTVTANVAGGTVKTTDHAGYAVITDFDGFANPVRVTDSLGNTLQSATYNVRGMKTAMTDMDMGSWAYEYTSLGELLRTRDAKTTAPAWTTVATYDALGRMITRQDVPEGVTSTWTWGTDGATAKNVGRLASLTTSDSSYAESYTYNQGRPATKTVTISGQGSFQIDYAYNIEGTLEAVTYPTSTSSYRLKVKYTYQNGILKSLSDFNVPSTVFWQANTTNARGQVTQEQFGNGLITNKAFDAVTGWVSTIQTGPAGTPTSVQNLGYLFDRDGNLTQRQDNRQGLTESFVSAQRTTAFQADDRAGTLVRS